MTLRITAHDCAHDWDPQEAGQRPLGIFQLRTYLSVVLCAPSHLHDIPWCSIIPRFSMIFRDVPRHSMIFHDIPLCSCNQWNSVIFYNIPWCSTIFHDIQLYYMIFHDAPHYNTIPWYSSIFQYIPTSSTIFNDIVLHSVMFNYVQRYSMIVMRFHNVPRCSMIFFDVPR